MAETNIKKTYMFFPFFRNFVTQKNPNTQHFVLILLYFCLYLFAKTEYFSKTPKPHRVEFSSSIQSDLL